MDIQDNKIVQQATWEYDLLYEFALANGFDASMPVTEFPITLGRLLHEFDKGSHGVAPKLNLFGVIYPHLDNAKRAIVLKTTIDILEGLDGAERVDVEIPRVKGMDAVAHIHEPWLNGDIKINTGASFWPDLSEYAKAFKKGMMPEEFDKWFLVADGTGPKSLFWGAAYSLSRVDSEYDLSLPRAQFFERFAKTGVVERTLKTGVVEKTSLIDRTYDAIAAFMYDSAYRDENLREKDPIPMQKGIEERLKSYAPDCRDGIEEALKRQNWVYLQSTIERRREIARLRRNGGQ